MQLNSITVITNTAVKAVVTDKLKEVTHKTFVKKLKELEHQKEQVMFQKQMFTKKLEADQNQLNTYLVKINKVEAELNAKISQYNERIQQIFKWVNGQEILQSQVQTLVNIQEGEVFNKAVSKEIIIKDGVVVEIRSSGGLNIE
ncbi:hypothetical protein IMX26_04450 [Clostridium sp. 'deep sea']|uniref:YlqD family protein n=1 Tax=Clostridium sp. 'deep sea' TaxID=2779445 RepID=UPI00189696AA|nr:YlqD family protein [Clostridium sp. 'deep sea']QOR36070.1 hypothetical protein IMX26_04450 [Clostridium sp. 'deep sea']